MFGVSREPGDPSVTEAVAQLLAHDAEADVVTDASIGSDRLLTGVYNRRCVWVRGNLGRTIRIVTVPMPPSHHDHH